MVIIICVYSIYYKGVDASASKWVDNCEENKFFILLRRTKMTSATYSNTERYLEFVTQVTTSPELSRQLELVNDTADMVELAAVAGYVFTADELKSASHEAKIMVDSSEGELSEQDLEQV